MRNKLLTRIARPYIVLVIILLIGLGLYVTNLVRNFYLENLVQNLTKDAQIISDQIPAEMVDPVNLEQINDLVKKYAAIMDLRITIIDLTGKVIADSDADPEILENHANRPEFIQAINSGFGENIRNSASINIESLYVAIPIQNEQAETIGVSRTSVSISSVNQKIRSIQFTIFGTSLFTALIVIILAFMINRRTLEPLKQLNSSIDSLEIEGFEYKQKAFPSDEIEFLSNYFWQLTDFLNKQNEDLNLERRTLNAVLNQMSDAVFIIDSDGYIQLSNPASERMFNFQKEVTTEKNLIEILRNHKIYELWNQCRKDHVIQETTIEIKPNKLFVQAIVKPLDEIIPDGVLLVIQDLTKVRQLEKIRSDFVSNVSHELRTPIASIKALTETLQEGALDDPPAARRFLSRMDVEIDNLFQLVQELLELSKIESGRVPIKKIICSPKELIEIAKERMQVQAERSGLELSADVPDYLPELMADPDKVGQVLVNLIHNAIKFTPPGGKIIIKAINEGTQVVFSITDTGVGIESELLSRIFERFYKTDRARSSGGTGLGLSITKHIIDSHNGKVWVESQVGEGSTFYFSLPTS